MKEEEEQVEQEETRTKKECQVARELVKQGLDSRDTDAECPKQMKPTQAKRELRRKLEHTQNTAHDCKRRNRGANGRPQMIWRIVRSWGPQEEQERPSQNQRQTKGVSLFFFSVSILQRAGAEK